jgi:hypothetical protein
MSNTVREVFNEYEREVIATALQHYANFCKKNADRKIIGYGKATELEKKEAWKRKQEEINQIQSKWTEECT